MLLFNAKVPIKCWCHNPEQEALRQAENLAALPFIFKHVALMPDTHCGYGMPIGGVIATKGVVIPNAVGVDIGCGMCAVKTSLKNITRFQIKKIFADIRENVPVGFKHHKHAQYSDEMPACGCKELEDESYFILKQEYNSSLKQLGTLGGGNHFIEIQKGDDGYIWIMLHSGSRNLGKKVADHYNKVAKELNTKWHSAVPSNYDLAFLPLDSEEGQNYLKEMQYCVDFAFASRKLMMERIIEAFRVSLISNGMVTIMDTSEILNVAHNYARMENHFGSNVMVHRKGATSAKEGEIGIIPGSQGTCSYIVKGKGNPQSFSSCSHGAGRTMSRTKAKETLSLEDEIELMDKQGIVHSIRNKNDLDEAPSSYKDIDVVMEEQKDLVEIVTKLTPLGVIKA